MPSLVRPQSKKVKFKKSCPSLFYLSIKMKIKKQFGGKITPYCKGKYSNSPQWDGRKFVNEKEAKLNVNWKTLPGLIAEDF
mgnify:CR=1 FL=1